MTDAESRLFAMNTAIIAALRVSLAAHPDRVATLAALHHVADQTEGFLLGQPMPEKSLDAAREVFASLTQSLLGDLSIDPESATP